MFQCKINSSVLTVHKTLVTDCLTYVQNIMQPSFVSHFDVVGPRHLPTMSVHAIIRPWFKAKTPKSINRNIYRTINPTNKRSEDRVQMTKSTLWVVRHYPEANTTWLTAAILKNRYDVVFLQWVVRLGRNSAAGCRITRRLRRNVRDCNRKQNSNMVDVCFSKAEVVISQP